MHWTTIQLILIVSIDLNWTTVQTDYTNVFAQATLDEEVYMEIPKKYLAQDVENDHVLKINKRLYVLRQAPLSCFEYLKTHLESPGFTSSSTDQCLFIKKESKIFCLILSLM